MKAIGLDIGCQVKRAQTLSGTVTMKKEKKNPQVNKWRAMTVSHPPGRARLGIVQGSVSYAPTRAPPLMCRASGYNAEKSCLGRWSSVTEAGTKIERLLLTWSKCRSVQIYGDSNVSDWSPLMYGAGLTRLIMISLGALWLLPLGKPSEAGYH